MDHRNRPLRVAAGLLLAALTALAAVEWPRLRAWYNPPRADLPAPDEIVRLRATASASGSRGAFETDIPWFDLPIEPGQRIWRRFTPNEYLSRPSVDPALPLGEMEATTADGRVTRVRFYETLADDLVFTADGEHFFRAEPRNDLGHPLGGGLLLAGTLRYAWVTAAYTGVAAADPPDAVASEPVTESDQNWPDMKSLSIR